MTFMDSSQTGRQRMRNRRRRGDSGLTTLEWLLIVAAVAGLAALAVVLVTNVVSDTSEQISGQNARLTAAKIAADEITTKARAETAVNDATKAKHYVKLNTKYKADCNDIPILYSDISGLDTIWHHDITSNTPPASDADVTSDTVWNAGKQGCLIAS